MQLVQFLRMKLFSPQRVQQSRVRERLCQFDFFRPNAIVKHKMQITKITLLRYGHNNRQLRFIYANLIRWRVWHLPRFNKQILIHGKNILLLFSMLQKQHSTWNNRNKFKIASIQYGSFEETRITK